MMNSDPLQCLIAVIVMDLKIMDRERARQGAMIIQQQDTVIISVWSAKYGPVHALFIYKKDSDNRIQLSFLNFQGSTTKF